MPLILAYSAGTTGNGRLQCIVKRDVDFVRMVGVIRQYPPGNISAKIFHGARHLKNFFFIQQTFCRPQTNAVMGCYEVQVRRAHDRVWHADDPFLEVMAIASQQGIKQQGR